MAGGLVDVDEVSAGESDDAIVFTPLESEPGLRIVDRIERRQYDLSMPAGVVPAPADASQFPAPVDAAVRVHTSAVTLPQRETVYIRNAAGETVAQTYDSDRSCPAGRYLIDVTTPVKLYLSVEAPVKVRPTPSSTTIEFEEPTAVVLGARSPHSRPGGTITTTEDLDELRAAVSSLGSALKTTSPERSFPTLRGYPPRIELGDEWSSPAHIDPPETGVTIEVERTLEDLLVASPLAFYLGAELEWGDRRIRTDSGFVHSLTSGLDFETGVERALQQTFLLDCLTRTEGLYPVDLDERRTFEARADGQLDFAELYHQPSDERLETYLDVSYESIADLVPSWSATTYVQPEPHAVTYLPYVVDTLSTIRTSGPERLTEASQPNQGLGQSDAPLTRSAETASRPPDADPHLVLPEERFALATAWVGEGVPIGASKALAAGFENRLQREPTSGEISIQVVCNEPTMRPERDSVEDVYRGRSEPTFDVDVRTELSSEELRSALERETDLFHFIGHIDEKGFRCPDGWLDADACETIGADVFLLNSCRSYEQGEALIRLGAIAGIATLTDLLNHHAADIGRTLGSFLNHGFPLYAALDVVRDTHRFGNAYSLLGDAHMVLSQPTKTIPEYLELKTRTEEAVTVSHRTFPSHWAGVGTLICPPYEPGNRRYLLGGELDTIELTAEELEEVLALPMPLRDGGNLRFSLDEGDDGGI